jgi:hypothetical protein
LRCEHCTRRVPDCIGLRYVEHMTPSLAPAVDAPIAFLFAIVRHRRRATEEHR